MIPIPRTEKDVVPPGLQYYLRVTQVDFLGPRGGAPVYFRPAHKMVPVAQRIGISSIFATVMANHDETSIIH